MSTTAQIMSGYTTSGMPYVSGVPCLACGKFVGRDGYIGIDTFEMSETVCGVEGECARCLARPEDD